MVSAVYNKAAVFMARFLGVLLVVESSQTLYILVST
jgi:hypothetical protein